jgi:NAD(P)-dependent dehydrogenase (short-subunit alcohol dehydrogenase family)
MSSAVDYQNSTLFNLHGRIALVSGGGTGIGLMIARGLAANGAKVYIGGRRKEVLETVAAQWPVHGKIIPYARPQIRSPLICTDKPSSNP